MVPAVTRKNYVTWKSGLFFTTFIESFGLMENRVSVKLLCLLLGYYEYNMFGCFLGFSFTLCFI